MKHRLSTRFWYVAYLVLVHTALAGMAYYLLRDQLYWFLGVEALLLVSALMGYRFYNSFMQPTRLIEQGEGAMLDRDFATKFLPTPSPEVNRLVGLYNAMMDNLRLERTGKQAQQYFLQQLIETAPIGVIIYDYDGHIATMNPWMRDLLNIGDSTPLPHTLADVAHPLANALGQLPADTATILQLGNNRRYRLEHGTFIDRGFQRRFLLVQDMTRHLLEAEKEAYGKVIRMMAHEVNNSTGATRSLLTSLMDALHEAPDTFPPLAATYLPVVIDRGERMNEFMRHFASVIRLPAPRLVALDLCGLAQHVATLFGVRCRDAGVQLTLRLPDAPTIVTADVGQIEQVFINALTNALESLGHGGHIEIAVHEKPRGFSVSDDGPGIPTEVAHLLFSPFFSTKTDGQGIGLTLSRDILEQHNAHYSLATDPETGWTRFGVVF